MRLPRLDEDCSAGGENGLLPGRFRGIPRLGLRKWSGAVCDGRRNTRQRLDSGWGMDNSPTTRQRRLIDDPEEEKAGNHKHGQWKYLQKPSGGMAHSRDFLVFLNNKRRI